MLPSLAIPILSEEFLLELRLAAALLPFIVLFIGDEPADTIYCSDASKKGFALHSASAEGKLVATACAVRERWRFSDPRPGPASDVPRQDVTFAAASSAFLQWAVTALTDDERAGVERRCHARQIADLPSRTVSCHRSSPEALLVQLKDDEDSLEAAVDQPRFVRDVVFGPASVPPIDDALLKVDWQRVEVGANRDP